MKTAGNAHLGSSATAKVPFGKFTARVVIEWYVSLVISLNEEAVLSRRILVTIELRMYFFLTRRSCLSSDVERYVWWTNHRGELRQEWIMFWLDKIIVRLESMQNKTSTEGTLTISLARLGMFVPCAIEMVYNARWSEAFWRAKPWQKRHEKELTLTPRNSGTRRRALMEARSFEFWGQHQEPPSWSNFLL